MSSIDQLKTELMVAAKLKSRAERAVSIAAVIAEALRTVGQDPILVGGAAVEFYTQGGYTTADIDLVVSGGPDLIRIMKELGFKRLGKDFVDEQRKIYIEFPSRALKENEESLVLQLGSKTLRIISIEDLIVDRLNAYKFWRSEIDGVNALLLLELGDVDLTRLEKRSKEEEVADALKVVRDIREQVLRQRLSRRRANTLLKDKMKSLKMTK